MKTTPFLLLACSLLLSPVALAINPLPQGDVYVQGTAERAVIPAVDYRGHLLPALADYHYCLRCTAGGKRMFTANTLRLRRGMVFDLARRFPAEVNDLLQRADGSWATPLSMAVQAQDAELVDLLLKLGALPFSPSAACSLSELPPLPDVSPNEKINKLLHKAMQNYDPLATLLKGTQPLPPRNAPSHGKPGSALRHICDTLENIYLCEPGVENSRLLYHAFNRLGGAQSSLLRVQPISRVIVQPEENEDGHYGYIITTGRVVDALTGVLPSCEFITWQIVHEGPIAEDSRHPALKDEPVFFSLSPKRLEKAVIEEKHLKLRNDAMDSFDICHGEEWQAIFERVLADYPEMAEPIAATAEELAAARSVIEEAPVIARATIFRYRIELDEEAGLAHMKCLATLRDPLKGALIKGALRDWSNIEYRRSFPISDEWRQRAEDCRAGRAGAYADIPVILTLAPTDKAEESCWVDRHARTRMKVLQVFDSHHDAPMFRALNELSLCPGAE